MSYYATGGGTITISAKKENADTIKKILDEEFNDVDVSLCEDGSYDFFVSRYNRNYWEEDVYAALEEAGKYGKILAGEIEWTGEDDSMWRMLYNNGEWTEDSGHVEYNPVETNKVVLLLKTAIKAFVYYSNEVRRTAGQPTEDYDKTVTDWLQTRGFLYEEEKRWLTKKLTEEEK